MTSLISIIGIAPAINLANNSGIHAKGESVLCNSGNSFSSAHLSYIISS